MSIVLQLVRANAKAIAAFLISLVAGLVLRSTGTAMPSDIELTLNSLVVSLIVWVIPNKQ